MTIPDVRSFRTVKAPDHSVASVAEPSRSQDARDSVVDRSIGQFIREIRNLDDAQIEKILIYQRNHNLRFGEAAIALKLASSNDVLWALSRQFHYPYATEGDVVGFDDELIAAIDPFSDQAEIFRDIRSQLFSTPTLPDGDIIAVLLTDRPFAEIGTQDSNALIGATAVFVNNK